MPYSNNSELPDRVKDVLPSSAQSVFRRAFNSAFSDVGEQRAFKIAWGAVKNAGYKKKDGKWIKESMNSIEWIKEHCTECAEDLWAVATALLSVEEHLDYALYDELRWILRNYVIQRAELEPDGLKSILRKFPMEQEEIEDVPNIEESLTSYACEIFSKAREIKQVSLLPFENLIKESFFKEASDDNKDGNKAYIAKLKSIYASLPEWAMAIGENMEESLNSTNSDHVLSGTITSDTSSTVVLDDDIIVESAPEEFRESVSVIKESDSSGDVWSVKLIQQGMTLSGRYFTDDVLRESAPLFEGARAYLNHPPEEFRGGDRPVQTLIGWYDNVELREGDGLYADWHILSNSGASWLKDQILELSDKGKLDLVGLSLLGLGRSTIKKVDGKPVKFAEAITSVRSVDLVDVPGAGGRIDSLKLSAGDKMELQDLSLEDLKDANPELYAQIIALGKDEAKAEFEQTEVKEEVSESLKESAPSYDVSVIERLEIREKSLILDDKIRESKLPNPMRVALREKFGNKNFNEEDLDREIGIYRESAAEMGNFRNPMMHLPSQVYTITEEEKVQAAMDKLFGLEVADKYQNVPKFRGIQEAYLGITGDYDFTWGALPLDERFRFGAGSEPVAANVVGGATTTFANVLGTSINRRLVRQYKRQPMWWEPIVNIVELNNLKQQDRNRLESLGSLTERTTGGAEFASIQWAENVETYTPTEYGNIVPIAQRAVVNDDLRALVRVTDELARSAGITLNEYVSNLFTQNSGDGPALADTYKVFDATNHQNNRITAALSRASFNTADQTIRKFTDNDSKRIGLTPDFLIIPHDLREMALQIQGSSAVPDSANNAINIFAGTFGVIEVPQFTDVNNWYLMAGPGQADCLEMGFLNGRREPEMFVQASPDQGMMFTHDVIAYKIRHRYGGDWLDYRGAVGSIVA